MPAVWLGHYMPLATHCPCYTLPSAKNKDTEGWTPLHYAAAGEGDTETIEFLLKLGVPPRKKDKTGRRPIDWAKVAGNGEAEYTLEQFKVTLYDD